jgi:hypothetical protein
MRIKFICCDVFARLAYAAAAASPHIVDLELLPMLAHTEPDKLREELRVRIAKIDAGYYDRVALGYGLCGNATVGLSFPVLAVMPRAHDCCAVFMGSCVNFLKAFSENLSMRWCTCGYYERGWLSGWLDENITYHTHPEYVKLLETYGEDNAEYVWKMMHPPLETNEAAYIALDGFEYNGTKEHFTAEIERQGNVVRAEKGDAGWFFRLVNGPWDTSEFLFINPGEAISPVYDMEEVVRTAQAI